MKKLFLPLLFSGVLVGTGHARLGEQLNRLQERYGKPMPQTRKDTAAWLFEGEDGRLVLSVTFNAKGESIAEGLKPVKYGRLTRAIAENFIEMQIGPMHEAKTARVVNPGEKYTFAGKPFVCAEQEYVIVDETNAILVVWNKSGIPSVIAVGPEMVQ